MTAARRGREADVTRRDFYNEIWRLFPRPLKLALVACYLMLLAALWLGQ